MRSAVGSHKLILAMVTAAVAIMLLASCVTPSQTILTHANAYAYYLNDYEYVCVDNLKSDNCDAYFAAMTNYKKRLIAASEAGQRGGKYKLQLKALDEAKTNVEAINGKRP